MNDTNIAAGAVILNAIDWGKVPAQEIIETTKDQKFSIAITEWLAECKWKEVKVYLKSLFADEAITFNGFIVLGYGLIKNATFKLMLRDIGEKRRCWKDEEEFLAFCRQYPGKLGPNGNFGELENGRVVDVLLDVRGLPYVYYVFKFSSDGTWSAECEHRVFSPQRL